ncbi:hypothetical protein CBR_g11984 [Chara braunii]|uniref:Integrase zinc-binding domain-containing protein n=1 Tax=Chara braunii TaxID=69332 RepID=A0A388KQT9_CHABU|nr:hypothetical protein CBR_g11984 [Chara braunii]|eukprot:GBG72406.1 hypothetical protein CBR_g11984 [Chara braunii]
MSARSRISRVEVVGAIRSAEIGLLRGTLASHRLCNRKVGLQGIQPEMPEAMADGGRKLLTIDDLVEALDKHERAPSNVPKVDTFHFKGERVFDWLDLTEEALVGLSDEVKLQRVLRYVLHSHHHEVGKVVEGANGSWARFRDMMQRKYRLGDGLLTTVDLEAMNKDDFSTIGAFVHEFKRRARKVHGIAEETQCAIFLGLLIGSEASELTGHGGGSEKLTWATIDKEVEEGSLDQVEQHQVRLQRRKRKERDRRVQDPRGEEDRYGRIGRGGRWVHAQGSAELRSEEVAGSEVAGTAQLAAVEKNQKCNGMVDTGAEMNIIREKEAVMIGMEIDHSDHGMLLGANCKAAFCGTASNTEMLIFNKHDGTMILLLCNPACGNHEVITCRNTGPGSGRNRPNLGLFTFEESESERRRLWEVSEEEGRAEVLTLSLTDVNKAMEVVSAHDMADPEAIKALREQVLENPQLRQSPHMAGTKGVRAEGRVSPQPFEEEDPCGSKDVGWMMKLALAGTQSLVEEVRTIEEGPTQVEEHEQLMGGMYLLTNTLLQGDFDRKGSFSHEENEILIPESRDNEFEKGEIKEAFRAKEYNGTYRELGLLLSCEMSDRDASAKAQKMRHLYVVRDGHLFIKRQVGNPMRIVCGRNRQIDIIAAVHDGIAGGHRGVSATCAKISELYHWDGMLTMVIKYCRSCIPCQERSAQRPGEPLHPRLEREVGAVVHLNLLFMPAGENGCNYIFDARDNLIGFVDGRAIRIKTGPVLANCIEEYYLRYPFVREFVMDRGSEFTCNEAYATREGWSTLERIRHLRGVGRFEEPIAHIREEALTWQDVEARMQMLRASSMGPDGLPIRLEESNAEEFIPAYEQYMRDQGTGQEEWMQMLPLWTRRVERSLARQIRDREHNWEDCQAQLRQAFRRLEPEKPKPRVERRQRSKRPRGPEARGTSTTRGGRKALAQREGLAEAAQAMEPVQAAGPAQAAELPPTYGLEQVEFRRITGSDLRGPSPTLPEGGEAVPLRTPLDRLEANLDASQWGVSQLGADQRGPARYEPVEEEPPEPGPEAGAREPEGPQAEGVITVGDDTTPPTPIPEQARQYWPEGIPEPNSEELLGPPLEATTPPPTRAEPERGERARTPTIVAPQLIESTGTRMDVEVPTSGEPPLGPPPTDEGTSEKDPLRTGHEARTDRPPEETKEEKRARVQIRLEELYQEKLRMEAAGESSKPPIDPPTSEQRISEAWTSYEGERDAVRLRSQEVGQKNARVGKARETEDLGFSAARMEIKRTDRRIGEVAISSFHRYSMLNDELAASRLEVGQLSSQLAEERAENQAWRTRMEAKEAE